MFVLEVLWPPRDSGLEPGGEHSILPTYVSRSGCPRASKTQAGSRQERGKGSSSGLWGRVRPLARAGDVPTSFQSSQPWESRLGPCAWGCAAPSCAVPCGTAPHTTVLRRGALCCAVRHATPRHAVPHRAEPCHAVQHRAVPPHAVPCRAIPHRAVLCHVVPCGAAPCHAVPRGAVPCHAVPWHSMPCCAVPCRGAGCSPLAAPPVRAQAAGSVCWRLCAFQFLGHSPSKPLRGRRQLGAVTNKRRAPMTPAPSAECQHRGGPRGGGAPRSPHPTEQSSLGRSRHKHAALGLTVREGAAPCRTWWLAGERRSAQQLCHGPQHAGRRNPACVCAGRADGAQRAQRQRGHRRLGLVNVSWNVCRSRPGEIKGPCGAAGARGSRGPRGRASGRLGDAGRSGLARCSHSTLLQCFAH